jgi:hypothetical protein
MREEKKKVWFRAKEYGWGWYPISWEGWLSIVIFALFCAFVLIWMLNQKDLLSIFLGILIILFLFGVLFFICYKKGEEPGWRWNGKPLKRRNKK